MRHGGKPPRPPRCESCHPSEGMQCTGLTGHAGLHYARKMPDAYWWEDKQ